MTERANYIAKHCEKPGFAHNDGVFQGWSQTVRARSTHAHARFARPARNEPPVNTTDNAMPLL